MMQRRDKTRQRRPLVDRIRRVNTAESARKRARTIARNLDRDRLDWLESGNVGLAATTFLDLDCSADFRTTVDALMSSQGDDEE